MAEVPHAAKRTPTQPPAWLVVYYSQGTKRVPLKEGKTLVIGRGADADLIIQDATLSRCHTSFTLKDGQISYEDLQSRNGTWVNEGRQDHGQLEETDEITMGRAAARAYLRQDGTSTDPKAALLPSHEAFVDTLVREASRSRRFGRTLGLILLRDDAPGPMGWVTRIQEQLRPVDSMSMYGPSTVEIATPETSRTELMALAEKLIAGQPNKKLRLRCGVALMPEAAASAEELLEACRMALQRTSDDHPLRSAESQSESDLARQKSPSGAEDGPVVCNPAMRELYKTVSVIAKSTVSVLIFGETGSGKEVVAREIHEQSSRKNNPLRFINCGAIPKELVESTLFGHERGAFTGAGQKAKGLFEEASTGTVLLDEIGELPLSAQAALLRVAETKTVSRIGSTKEIPVDVRILAATHRDLEAMCDEGSFRRDLLYRLNTMTLWIPPLRDRPEDIKPLAERFVAMASEANSGSIDRIGAEAMDTLQAHTWPGNVRELRNVIERAVILAQGHAISVADLPERLRRSASQHSISSSSTIPPLSRSEKRSLVSKVDALAQALPDDKQASADLDVGLKEAVQNFEARSISEALSLCGGNQSAAARYLGIPQRTLSDKVARYAINYDAENTGVSETTRDYPLQSNNENETLKTRVQQYEIQLIRNALQECGSNEAAAAKRLGVSLRSLVRKIQSYGIMKAD
jgi:DNA-binding NtrC family response regulator